jgi:ssDNA-binding Zn-finger/Zn-ribbon topoisomerase 1
MKCPKCGKEMLIKETTDFEEKVIKIAVCNNFRDCDFDEEDSRYNKYIKWFVKTYRLDRTLISSQGVKTRKD